MRLCWVLLLGGTLVIAIPLDARSSIPASTTRAGFQERDTSDPTTAAAPTNSTASTSASIETITERPATTSLPAWSNNEVLSNSVAQLMSPIISEFQRGLTTDKEVILTPVTALSATTSSTTTKDHFWNRETIISVVSTATTTAFGLETSGYWVPVGTTSATSTDDSGSSVLPILAPTTISLVTPTPTTTSTVPTITGPTTSSGGPTKRVVLERMMPSPTIDSALQQQLMMSAKAEATITVVHATILATVSYSPGQGPTLSPSPTTLVADICDGTTLVPAFLADTTATTWTPVGSDTSLAVTMDKTTLVTTVAAPTTSGNMAKRDVPRATALPPSPEVPVIAPSIHAIANKRQTDSPPPTDPSAVAALPATTSRQINNAVEALLNTDPAVYYHPGDDRRDAAPRDEVIMTTATIAGRDGLPTAVHQSSGKWVAVSTRSVADDAPVTSMPSLTKIVSTTPTAIIRERQATTSAPPMARTDDGSPDDEKILSSAIYGRGKTTRSTPATVTDGDVDPNTTTDTSDAEGPEGSSTILGGHNRQTMKGGKSDDEEGGKNSLAKLAAIGGALGGATGPTHTGKLSSSSLLAVIKGFGPLCEVHSRLSQRSAASTNNMANYEDELCALVKVINQENGGTGSSGMGNTQGKTKANGDLDNDDDGKPKEYDNKKTSNDDEEDDKTENQQDRSGHTYDPASDE